MTPNSVDVWWNQGKYWHMPKPPELSDERPNIPAIILEAQRLERTRIATCLHSIARKESLITGDDAILVVPYAMALLYINPPEKP